MAIELEKSDYVTEVPYGFNGEKITISEMVKTKEFTSLEPLFAERILDMIRDNPSIGILKGGGGRSAEEVRNLFYANYKKINDAPDYENDPTKYEAIKSGKIKWNPEDGEWYKMTGRGVYAVPGGSWHEGGYAVDFTGNVNLAGKVSKKYQLEQVTGTGETHHFQPLGVPISKRMFLELKNTYGIDAIKTPLSPDILLFINKEIASNVPRHPERIKKVLDAAIAKFKTGSGISDNTFASDKVLTFAGQSNAGVKIDWGQVSKVTPTTVAKALVIKPTTTTTTTSTSLPATTTTSMSPASSSTLPKISNVGRIPGANSVDTPVSTVPKTTTTMAPAPATSAPAVQTSTTVPLSTSTSSLPTAKAQTVTTPPTSTTVKPTTTTVPRTTIPVPTVPPVASTVPAAIPGSEDITAGDATWTAAGGISYAGGINPNYKGLSKIPDYVGADSSKPYTYTNDDWQTILGYSVDKTIQVQKQLMKAFPGFVPGALGDSRDPKTIATFKKALARINMVSQDPSSTLRGKKLDDAIVELGKTPTAVAGASTRLPSYQMTSPSDLKAVFKKAAQDTIGRTLGDGDLNRLVETYQAQQVQYQKQLETGGSMVTQVPSAESFINRNIEKDFGTEVNTQKLDNIFGAIDQALTGGQQ